MLVEREQDRRVVGDVTCWEASVGPDQIEIRWVVFICCLERAVADFDATPSLSFFQWSLFRKERTPSQHRDNTSRR